MSLCVSSKKHTSVQFFLPSRKCQFSEHQASIRCPHGSHIEGIFPFNALRIRSHAWNSTELKAGPSFTSYFIFFSLFRFQTPTDRTCQPERICWARLTHGPIRTVTLCVTGWKLLSRMKGKSVSLHAVFPRSSHDLRSRSFLPSFFLRRASESKSNSSRPRPLHLRSRATCSATCFSRGPRQSAQAFSSGPSDVILQAEVQPLQIKTVAALLMK